MATRDQIAQTPQTGGFAGRCWVMPPSHPDKAIEDINNAMQQEAATLVGDTIVLKQTGLVLVPNQIIVILTHGTRANLFVCDSMEVNQ